jgi:hypothetical protein
LTERAPTAVQRTMVSPRRAITAPSAWRATLPVSSVSVLPPQGMSLAEVGFEHACVLSPARPDGPRGVDARAWKDGLVRLARVLPPGCFVLAGPGCPASRAAWGPPASLAVRVSMWPETPRRGGSPLPPPARRAGGPSQGRPAGAVWPRGGGNARVFRGSPTDGARLLVPGQGSSQGCAYKGAKQEGLSMSGAGVRGRSQGPAPGAEVGGRTVAGGRTLRDRVIRPHLCCFRLHIPP